MRHLFTVSIFLGLWAVTSVAQEHGRAALPPAEGGSGLGRDRLPPASYDGFLRGGTWGAKLSLGWASVDWSIGPADGSETLFAPQVSLFYKTTDYLDINLSVMLLSAEDEDEELGATDAKMTRVALGVRRWIDKQSRITPYFGGGIGYCLVDGTTENTMIDDEVVPATVSVEDTPGIFIEGGAAVQIADTFFINADITYDMLLGSSSATINGEDEDFEIASLSLNLGAIWMF